MSNIRPEIRRILDNGSESYNPCEYGAGCKTANAELDYDSLGIPAIHFTWQEEVTEYCLNSYEVLALQAGGFIPCLESKTPDRHHETLHDGKAWSFRALAKQMSHVWFMNFRRYSWSWTTEVRGKGGYCHGPCYANSELPIHHIAGSAKQVVRDCLVSGWKGLLRQQGDTFCRAFGGHVTGPLLRLLLEDAYAHLSEHSAGWRERSDYTDNGMALPTISIRRDGETVEFTPTERPRWNRWANDCKGGYDGVEKALMNDGVAYSETVYALFGDDANL